MKKATLTFLAALFIGCGQLAAAGFSQPDAKAQPDLFAWTDTCNVYVLRDGDAALLVNLGDGSVLEHLSEIGVKRVEWVLFTDHHREQCQGAPRLVGTGAKVAAPEAERALFEQPASFRKLKPSLNDRFTVHSASYVRPLVHPVRLDRGFARRDKFGLLSRICVWVEARVISQVYDKELLPSHGRSENRTLVW